jgi:hypothetical protein
VAGQSIAGGESELVGHTAALIIQETQNPDIKGYLSTPVLFIYPYVFVAGPNKHDALLITHMPTEREI